MPPWFDDGLKEVRSLLRRSATVKDLAKNTVNAILNNESSKGLFKLYNMLRFGSVQISGSFAPLNWSKAEPENIRRAYEILFNLKVIPFDEGLTTSLKTCFEEDRDCKFVAMLHHGLLSPFETIEPTPKDLQFNYGKLISILGAEMDSPGPDPIGRSSLVENAVYVSAKIKAILAKKGSYVHRVIYRYPLEQVIRVYDAMYSTYKIMRTDELPEPLKEFYLTDLLRNTRFDPIMIPVQLEDDALMFKFIPMGGNFDIEVYGKEIGRPVIKTSGLKYVAYRKFVNVPLGFMRRSSFLRMLVQAIQLDNAVYVDAYHMKTKENWFFDLLSLISEYEKEPTVEDLKKTPVVSPQKSERAAFTCINAHLKATFGNRYRVLKLALTYEMLNELSALMPALLKLSMQNRTGNKDLKDLENLTVDPKMFMRPETPRVLLFAFEDYARSIISFMKRFNKTLLTPSSLTGDPKTIVQDISEFGNDFFWSQHKMLSSLINMNAEPQKLRIPAAFDAFYDISETNPLRKLKKDKLDANFSISSSQSFFEVTSREREKARNYLDMLTEDIFGKMETCSTSKSYYNEYWRDAALLIAHKWPIPKAPKMKGLLRIFTKNWSKRVKVKVIPIRTISGQSSEICSVYLKQRKKQVSRHI